VLVRHCDPAGGPSAVLSLEDFYRWEVEEGKRPLSARGRARATDLAGQIHALRPDDLLASPVRRAAETAEVIGARIGRSPQFWPELSEIRFGRWEVVRGIAARVPAPSQFWSIGLRCLWMGGGRVQGIDPPAVVAERAAVMAARLSELAEGRTVVVVGHGVATAFLIAALTGSRSPAVAWVGYLLRTGQYRILERGPRGYRVTGGGRGRSALR
jgi:broad specificity phosphatase PhoE